MRSVMIVFPYRFCFTILVACSIMVSGLVLHSQALAAELVYPHWTGKHCTECHVAEKIPELRCDGDVNELCNRCHGNEPPVCTAVHRKKSMLSDAMLDTIPPDWPHADGIISCLTCHAVQVQMHVNAIAEKENRNFLRGAVSGDLSSVCFTPFMFLASVSSSSKFLSFDFPDGSPIIPVAPPTRAIGL